MKRAAFQFFVLFIFIISCKSEDDNGQTTEPEVFDFSDRTYTVFDDGVSNNSACPVLLVLHGAGSAIQSMIQATNFNFLGGESGFLVVYPSASQGLWNYGEECELPFPERPDDVEFIKFLIDELSKKYNVDEKRIYVTGFSMGGYFSYYLARKLPGKFAAIAPVAATMPRYLAKGDNKNKIPILIELGTEDLSVPYEGTGPEDCNKLSGSETIRYWAAVNGCNSESEVSYLPDNGVDNISVRIDDFKNCSAPYETKLISVEGGGHYWYMNEEINISEIILDFFIDKSL